MRVIANTKIKYKDLLDYLKLKGNCSFLPKNFDKFFIKMALKSISQRIIDEVEFVDLPVFYDKDQKIMRYVQSYKINEECLINLNKKKIYLYNIFVYPPIYFDSNLSNEEYLIIRMTY